MPYSQRLGYGLHIGGWSDGLSAKYELLQPHVQKVRVLPMACRPYSRMVVNVTFPAADILHL
jgi:hypothetical protein